MQDERTSTPESLGATVTRDDIELNEAQDELIDLGPVEQISRGPKGVWVHNHENLFLTRKEIRNRISRLEVVNREQNKLLNDLVRAKLSGSESDLNEAIETIVDYYNAPASMGQKILDDLVTPIRTNY